MKEFKVVLVLPLLIALLPIFNTRESKPDLKAGDLEFISLKAKNEDGFTIITHTNLPPNTQIHFSDSEWNGNRFGADESELLWTSGNNLIQAESRIHFNRLNSSPSVSIGTLSGSMKISQKGDAVFAFIGYQKMPSVFLAAASNNNLAFGTLINTKLIMGETAITFE